MYKNLFCFYCPYYKQMESAYRKKHENRKATAYLQRMYTSTGYTFPASPFNGMQIDYAITGVTIKSSIDSEGFTTSRVLEGDVTGKVVRVYGKARMGSGYGADLLVKISDGIKPDKTFNTYIKSGYPNFNEASFDLELEISPQSENVEVFINMTGSYNAGNRGLEVIGNFKVAQTEDTDESHHIHNGKTDKTDKTGISETIGAGGFPTGSWKVGENGLLLIETTSSNSVLGYYYGIQGMQNKGEFIGTINKNTKTGLLEIDAIWTAQPPYQCISDKGRVRIIFSKDKKNLKISYSQCGSPYAFSGQIDGNLICPGFLNVAGLTFSYTDQKYPGMQTAKSGTLSIFPNTNNPGINGNGLIGLYDNNKGRLDGKIIGNVWIGSWFYGGENVDLKSGRFRVIFTLDTQNLTIFW